MLIDDKKVVTLAYTLSVLHPDGILEFVDKRDEQDPVDFVYGRGLVLPKVEEALAGKGKGFQACVKIKPEDAFGVRDENLVLTYPIAKLPKGTKPELGMKFQTQGPTGDVISVIVKEITDENVVLDGNHPLADAFIQFDLSVVRVREATAEELRTGEVQPARLH